jgi:hypothetical protein
MAQSQQGQPKEHYNAKKAEKTKELFDRSNGGDPEHPVAGSVAWAEKNNFPADTKDMPRS